MTPSPWPLKGCALSLRAPRGSSLQARWPLSPGPIDLVRGLNPSVTILDRAFGAGAVVDALERLRCTSETAVIVWGVGMSNADALRMVQSGAKGVVRKTSDTQKVLDCIRAVSAGETWMEDTILYESERSVPVRARVSPLANTRSPSWSRRASKTKTLPTTSEFKPALSKSI